jgi:RNA polymerase primary sigma factor
MTKTPLLTAEEEIALSKRILAGGADAKEARDKLVISNIRLANYYARKYAGQGVEFEDLVIMGQIGLIKAAEKYDYRHETRFSTYATLWILREIQTGIAKEGSPVRLPIHMNECACKVKRAMQILFQETGIEPGIDEIARYTGLSEKVVKNAMKYIYQISSLDAPIGENSNVTLGESIADENGMSPEDIAMDHARKEAVKNVLSELDAQEAAVLRRRNGFDDEPMTLEKVANSDGLGVSRERIRQIEVRTYRKILSDPSLRNKIKDFELE